MKLSELPTSLYHSLRLLSLSAKKLRSSNSDKIPVIISLTTIPSRMKTLPITIRSLLTQEILPEKIVLWLNKSFENKVPGGLKKLVGDVFEIRYSPYTFSHRKLIHSLEMFPDSVIITCDDDLIYHPQCLKLLYQEHLKNPEVVIGNRCRRISYSKEGEVVPYLQWPFVGQNHKGSKLLMPVGAFWVLYPPGVLDERVKDIELFMRLSPKSDDLWFKVMSLLKGTLSIQSEISPPLPIPLMATQSISLKKINNRQDYKRVQWEQISSYFDLKFDEKF